ncbi:MAG: hypothetical protein R3F56_03550 [Planctomycetota bacterium]
MHDRDQTVLREGTPRALDELRTVLAAAGIAARITKGSGCNPNG